MARRVPFSSSLSPQAQDRSFPPLTYLPEDSVRLAILGHSRSAQSSAQAPQHRLQDPLAGETRHLVQYRLKHSNPGVPPCTCPQHGHDGVGPHTTIGRQPKLTPWRQNY